MCKIEHWEAPLILLQEHWRWRHCIFVVVPPGIQVKFQVKWQDEIYPLLAID